VLVVDDTGTSSAPGAVCPRVINHFTDTMRAVIGSERCWARALCTPTQNSFGLVGAVIR
jgi:hypothetical protein